MRPGRRVTAGDVLLDFPLEQRLRYRTHHGVHVATTLEKKNAGNGADVVTDRRLLVRVDIELCDLDLALEFGRQLLDHRRHHPTRSAPRGPKIDQRESLLRLDHRVEVAVCNRNQLPVFCHRSSSR